MKKVPQKVTKGHLLDHSDHFIKSSEGKKANSLILDKLPGYFLISCLVVVFLFVLYFLSPFIVAIFLSAVLVIAFYPVYKRLLKWFKGWSRLASFTTMLIVVLVILVPLVLFVLLLTVEASGMYEIIRQKFESGIFDKYLQWDTGGFLYDLKMKVGSVIDLDGIDLKQNILGWTKDLSGFLVDQTKNIILGISGFMLSLIVMLFCMFYFFKDGDKLVKKIGDLSPLPSIYESELFSKIASMVKAVIFGVFLTAVVQGLVGGVGFMLAGISNPVFWGTTIAFFSLVPLVGTAVIWVPAAIVLVIMGDYGVALFIFLWGMLAIGTVDNFIRPYLIGGKAKTYPLMTFLVILGGVMIMGLKGVIIGPLVLVVLMSFFHIYEAEYKKVLK
jgi:predicted PurR-regulated permease PerM